MQLTGLVLVLTAMLEGGGGVGGARLPEDARLQAVRPGLEAILERTTAAGLPGELVVSKVREGLAKGVDGARIEQAAARLADSLTAARAVATARYPRVGKGELTPLVRALAEARMMGVEANATDEILRSGRPVAEAVRAVEILGDLSVRGYPAGRAVTVIRDVLARDPGSITQVTSALETLRQEQALSHAETVDALARGLAGSDSLKAGYGRAIDSERGGTLNRGQAKKAEREAGGAGSPGKKIGLEKMRPPQARGPKK